MRSAILAVLLLAGCAASQPQVREISPDCQVPPQPALPKIEGHELEQLPDEVYWRLEDRERRIVNWALEMRAMLRELCEPRTEEE